MNASGDEGRPTLSGRPAIPIDDGSVVAVVDSVEVVVIVVDVVVVTISATRKLDDVVVEGSN